MEFRLDRFCKVDGSVVTVASVDDESAVISNRPLGKGTVWYCGADVSETRSVFVQDGLALYALLASALGLNDTGTTTDSKPIGVGRVAGAPRAGGEQGTPELVLGTGAETDREQETLEIGHHTGVYRRSVRGMAENYVLAAP